MSASDMNDKKGGGDRAARFEEDVRPAELEAVREGRRLRREADGEPGDAESEQPAGEGEDPRLSALAFSGGGIRSATFNLGVTQGLARLGLLRGFDYLSINSGGSYIGSWLLAWIRRDGIRNVERQLRNDGCRQDERDADSDASASANGAEAGPISYLRQFTNYLTPRVGAFSADTWTMAATYLRNLLLNQAILVLALAAMLVAPRILVLVSAWFREFAPSTPLIWGVVFLMVAIALIACNQVQVMIPRRGSDPPWYARQPGIQAGVVLPVFVAAWLASLWLWFSRAGHEIFLHDWLAGRWTWYRLSELHQEQFEPVVWALLAGVIYLLVWIAGVCLLTLFVHRRKGAPVVVAGKTRMLFAVLLTAPAAGAIGGVLFWALASLSLALEGALTAAGYAVGSPWHLLHVTVWGAPAITIVFVLTAVIHIGLMGRAFPEALRQWWSRLGAWLMIWAVTWLGVFGIALYGPILLVIFGTLVCTALGGGWIVSTIGGVLVGRRAGDGESTPPVWRRAVIAAAPYVFIVGMLAAIALGAHVLLDPTEEYLDPGCRDFWMAESNAGAGAGPVGRTEAEVAFDVEHARRILECHTERLYIGTTRNFASEGRGKAIDDGNILVVPLACLLLAIAALLLSWRVDINEFSMHLFYRNRLVRAFLGASNRKRKAQSFTGFDPGDDLALSTLSPDVVQDGRRYDGPFPLIDIALNLVSGRNLAWQERKAASFVFTPLFSGFRVNDDAQDTGPHLQSAGYRPTGNYQTIPEGGISLGTAIAISGAAASPNMGAGTTPAMAFLLTVFNVRLGWWLGNPRHTKTWNRMGPTLGIAALLSELFGNTNDRSRYVYLSDGGHFDNLGLYELIRRRCRFIVVSDGGADPNITFEDLGNAIRKACSDFGVGFELDPDQIRRDPETGLSRWHCAVGKIRYDRIDGGPPGVIVYIKASLTGDEPVDVQAYAAAHPLFPHEPTSDQWFSESQFESYRKLGEHVALSVFGAVDDRPGTLSQEELCVRLSRTWFPPSRAPRGNFTRLTGVLDTLLERLRTDPDLAFLIPQIYPEWSELAAAVDDAPQRCMWLPDTHDELVAGFFFCHSLIQLMEECYIDIDLEGEYDHPDNRGWMNVFKHWSWAGMVRATWAVTASTFGARFQTFCERRLGHATGEVTIQRENIPVAKGSVDPGKLDKLLEQLAGDNRLNFLERDLVRGLVEAEPDIDRLLVLRLAVRRPDVKATNEEPDPSDELAFTFGFALARGDELLYLRVQDHLRKAGLARRAMRRLLRDGDVTRVAAVSREKLPDWCRETPGEDRVDALRNLLRSAREQET